MITQNVIVKTAIVKVAAAMEAKTALVGLLALIAVVTTLLQSCYVKFCEHSEVENIIFDLELNLLY